jgi:hypothetical protein
MVREIVGVERARERPGIERLTLLIDGLSLLLHR